MTTAQIIEIVLLALGLAMDAFAVAVSSGVTLRNMELRHAMRIAAFFGFFQAVMPLLGWAGGRAFRQYICAYDHWIAFVLLTIVGGKMIYDARRPDDDAVVSDPLNVYVLFTLAIATSIDALAVGVTFSFLEVDIWHSIGVIGAITFVVSFIGTQIGKRFGHLFENQLEIFGGLILIGIGLKILIHHQFFGG
ncbi:MAG: manganese efflux pump [Verrucomicrobia bacterium]|jgi:manganese efflux pump family protein|nr:manganese efflux pump [Verrucomicrobiota bacterium]MBT7068007.1 manganese efflux pump [Verrucomicrobiota bacterium]MBT7698972.1 manganese efflux pump [Verrucomicrobiota bacterium]